jgi:hypothetical protein
MIRKPIWTVALSLAQQHRRNAPAVARRLAAAAMNTEQREEMETWAAVALALDEWLKPTPGQDERVH